ncbi:MAG: group III truncated hemoglobin [Bacteroidetes bacterium]|nr:group III truncated hemoglobin [Bacteroidota bacterium]
MNDIISKSDIEYVVREQYRLLLEDPFTQPVFAHLELEVHLPKIFTFWSFVLDIDAAHNPYRGSAFEPHTKLGLTAAHFTKWLEYLHHTITGKFQGPNAQKWIGKSNELGWMFQYKLGLINDDSLLIRKKE